VNRELAFGYLYLGMNRYQEAALRFRCSVEAEKSAESLWLLALSLLATKQKDEAEKFFQEMQASFPADERGYVGLALLHAAGGAADSALAQAGKALHINPRSGEAHALLAYLHWSSARYAAAREAAEKAERRGFPVHCRLADPPEENGKDLSFITIGPGENDGVLSAPRVA
jgi:tetratricopeptide (TPR) repeat protein